MRRSLLIYTVCIALALVGTVVSGRSTHSPGVLSELDSTVSSGGPAIPGEQCFSSHEGLEKNGEENETLYSYKSFCESVVGDLSEAYENEKGFREACNEKYGITKCKHQCIQLAGLFDQTVIGRTEGGDNPYGISHGNKDGYTITQKDCENCLRLHQCTAKVNVA